MKAIIFCFALFACISCQSKKNAAQTQASATQTNSDENTFRVVVSFFSIGQGIDGKSNNEYQQFLDSYPKKISYEPYHWGREGEIDYCLKLAELSTTEQKDFVKKTREMLSKSTLISVDENAKCVHKH